MHPSKPSKAQQYRRKAKGYGTLAASARSGLDRKQLFHMRDACLAMAATQDWLNGVVPAPAANSNVPASA